VRPSTRLSTMIDADLTEIAHQRQSEPTKLTRFIRGDLDWIVMKCLEKDRTRRYETANGLATDIRRHLENEPVVACPPSAGYRFQKMVHRNKLAFAAVSAVGAALVIGLGIAAWQFLEKSRAYDRAVKAEKKSQTEAAKSQQVAKFLKAMLDSAGPSVARGRDATVLREMLEKTSTRVGRELQDQPEVQADIYSTIGSTFMDMGDHRRAITNFEQAVRSYRLAFRGDNRNLAETLSWLGFCQSFTGEVAQGSKNAVLGVEMARRCGDQEILFNCLEHCASSFNAWGMFSSESEIYVREAFELKKKSGNDPVGLATAMHLWSSFATNRDEEEKLSRDALAMLQKNLPPGHPQTVQASFSLGQCLVKSGKYEEAERTLREALIGFHKTHDPNHPYQPIVLRFLAEALLLQGKGDEAESLVRQQLTAMPTNASYQDLLRRVIEFRSDWPPDDEILQYLAGDFLVWDLADWLAKQDDQAEVERLLREGLRKQRQRSDPESPKLIGPIRRLADWCFRNGKKAEADSLCREALEIRRKVLGDDNLDAAKSLHDLAYFLQSQDKLAEAERVYREELAIRRKLQGENHLDVAEALRGVALMLQRQDNLPAAESFIREALAMRRKLLDPKDPGVAEVLLDLRGVLLQQGKVDDVEMSSWDGVDFLARRSQWKEVVARYRQKIESAPDDFGSYLRLSPVLLLNGDVDGYRRLCQQIITQFSGTKDIAAADTVAKACSLDPRAGVNLDTVAEAAETAVTLGKDSEYFPWFALCKSMSEYRQKHFAGATNWAQKSLAAAGQIPERDAAAYLVLAMAQMQSKQAIPAREAFDKAAEIFEKKLPKLDSGDLGWLWHDVLIANLLLREAKVLIGENDSHSNGEIKVAKP
jgi:tetratricopeptide (TPR) repeat protein